MKQNEWVALFLSLLTMAVGVTAFSYSTFVMKEVYKEDKAFFQHTLDRVESKIDYLIKLKK